MATEVTRPVTKKRWAVMVFLLLTSLIAGGIYWQCFSGRPTECSFGRVKPGMTLQQVLDILGSGEEIHPEQVPRVAPYAARLTTDGMRTTKLVEGDRFFKWPTDGGTFYISFEDERVVEKIYHVIPLF